MIKINLYRDRCVLDGSLVDIKTASDLLDKHFSYLPSTSNQVDYQLRSKLQNKNVPQHVIKRILDDIDHTVRLFNKDDLSFPPGLAYSAMERLRINAIDTYIESHIPNIDKRYHWQMPKGFEPREHQIDAANRADDILTKYHFMVNRMATGAGKTFSAAMTIARFGLKSMFIVPSQLLLEQAYEDFTYFFGDSVVGRMGAGYHEPDALITIVTFQALRTAFAALEPKKEKKKKGKKTISEPVKISSEARGRIEAVEATELVLVDEVHHLPADSYYPMMMRFKNAIYIGGYTATDRRADGGTIKIEAASGKTHFKISAAELINAGYLSAPMIYFNPIPLRKPPMFYTDKDRRDFYRDYHNFYRYQVIENTECSEMMAKRAHEAADRGKHVLVAINRKEHGEAIMEYIDDYSATKLVTSKTPKAWDYIKAFRRGEYPILISTLCSEGFNAPLIDNIIVALDSTDTEQIVGRGMRTYENKEVCRVDHMYHLVPHRNRDTRPAEYITRHAHECREIYIGNAFPIIRDIEAA